MVEIDPITGLPKSSEHGNLLQKRVKRSSSLSSEENSERNTPWFQE